MLVLEFVETSGEVPETLQLAENKGRLINNGMVSLMKNIDTLVHASNDTEQGYGYFKCDIDFVIGKKVIAHDWRIDLGDGISANADDYEELNFYLANGYCNFEVDELNAWFESEKVDREKAMQSLYHLQPALARAMRKENDTPEQAALRANAKSMMHHVEEAYGDLEDELAHIGHKVISRDVEYETLNIVSDFYEDLEKESHLSGDDLEHEMKTRAMIEDSLNKMKRLERYYESSENPRFENIVFTLDSLITEIF